MKQIKTITIEYDDGSIKGYNRNAFEEVMRIKWGDKLCQKRNMESV